MLAIDIPLIYPVPQLPIPWSHNMSLTSLPAELLDSICEPLSSYPSTLSSLALTCSSVNQSATRALYHSVSISAYARNLPIVCTLANRSELARLLRRFSITIDESNHTSRAYYEQLHAALREMPQLESLELLVDSNASWVLSGLDFEWPRLEHLTCSFPLDTHLLGFLAHTPLLRTLHLSECALPSGQALPLTHVPLLESYSGPASLLPFLAPRPLTTFHLSGDLQLENIPAFPSAPSAGEPEPKFYSYLGPRDSENGHNSEVQVFSAITSAPPAEVLAAVALAFPKLVYLRLMTTGVFWEAPDTVCLNQCSCSAFLSPSRSIAT